MAKKIALDFSTKPNSAPLNKQGKNVWAKEYKTITNNLNLKTNSNISGV